MLSDRRHSASFIDESFGAINRPSALQEVESTQYSHLTVRDCS